MNMQHLYDDDCAGETPRDRRNRRRYTLLLAVWALAFLSSTFLIASDVVTVGPLRWVAACVPSIFAIIAVIAYWRYLREADELAGAIQLKALAFAVSAGFIVWPAFELLAESGVPIDDWPNLTMLTMIGFYVFGVALGRRHYR
jgi:hypothetical protein